MQGKKEKTCFSLLSTVRLSKFWYDTFLMNLRVTVRIWKSQISIAEIQTGINDESKNHATISTIFLFGGVEYCLKTTLFSPSFLFSKKAVRCSSTSGTLMLHWCIWIWVFLNEEEWMWSRGSPVTIWNYYRQYIFYVIASNWVSCLLSGLHLTGSNGVVLQIKLLSYGSLPLVPTLTWCLQKVQVCVLCRALTLFFVC